MNIIRGLENFKLRYPNTILTIGNFDGLHLGHQKILSNVVKRAKEIKGTSMVMTFDPHPIKVLAPEKDLKLLMTFDEKVRLIEKVGIDILFCITFNREFANLLPDEFINRILFERIGAKEIIVGSNYTFGKNKKGTIELLRRRGKKYGFSVKVIRSVKMNGLVVSSSTIRNLLIRGAVLETSKFLGRAYSVEGTVIKGKGRGSRLMHIPTANITTPVEITPREGVYAVRVGLEGKIYEGVANIGKNPTFGNGQISYEVHILNFSRDILKEKIRIYFIDRIRSERCFPDVNSLEEQIRQDIEKAKYLLQTKHAKLLM